MNLPKKITPCPIIEAIVEIRFSINVPTSAVFGIIYNQIKEKYIEYEELPILELPRTILETDEKLKFQPHYKLFSDNYIIQIGYNMISISINNKYLGWTNFNNEIDYVVNILKSSGIVKKINRVGMRYIDFFEKVDIFNNIKLKISMNDEPFESISKYFRTETKNENFNVLLQISNKAEIKTKKLEKISGSLIDYDISRNIESNDFFENYSKILNDAHKILKENFFLNLLDNEFLTNLNPEY